MMERIHRKDFSIEIHALHDEQSDAPTQKLAPFQTPTPNFASHVSERRARVTSAVSSKVKVASSVSRSQQVVKKLPARSFFKSRRVHSLKHVGVKEQMALISPILGFSMIAFASHHRINSLLQID
jgi:hypothetical protein